MTTSHCTDLNGHFWYQKWQASTLIEIPVTRLPVWQKGKEDGKMADGEVGSCQADTLLPAACAPRAL